MTFFYVNARVLPECTESRRQFAEDSADPEFQGDEQEKPTKKVGEVESDSVDSPICACGSSMLMSHDVLLCENDRIGTAY